MPGQGSREIIFLGLVERVYTTASVSHVLYHNQITPWDSIGLAAELTFRVLVLPRLERILILLPFGYEWFVSICVTVTSALLYQNNDDEYDDDTMRNRIAQYMK